MEKSSDMKASFKVKTNESLANAIRRSTGLVPTMAVDEVEISRNDSALYDETLAHRIGMVPIKMDKSWKEDTVLKFKIDSKKETVYSGEIKGEFELVHNNIPLTLLSPGQELKIKGKTRMGIGKEHAKFSPGIIFYRDVAEISLDKDLEKEIRNAFPQAEIKEKGNKIVLKDDGSKTILDFCEGLTHRKKKKVEITETGEFLFTVESFGQMKVEEIFRKSIEALEKELKNISKKIK
jgi:DNA-directed RNA polymerase subunit D